MRLFGSGTILKNAIGVFGVIVIIGICITPILKLAALSIAYNLTASICQPVADKKITDLLIQIGDTFKILLGIMCTVSMMLIIGTTLVVKISNSSLMYR